MNVALRSMVLTGLYITRPRAAKFLHGGEKRRPAMAASPASLLSLEHNCPPSEPSEDARPQLPAPAFSPEPTAALTPSPSRATAFACSMKQPAPPSSTWRASPYYAGFPCCPGPQGPLSSRDLQQLMALPLSPLLCLELSEASTPRAFGDGMMKGMKQKPGFRYLLLSRQH